MVPPEPQRTAAARSRPPGPDRPVGRVQDSPEPTGEEVRFLVELPELERFVRRHPRLLVVAADVALGLLTLVDLVAIVRHWPQAGDPLVAVLLGLGAGALAASLWVPIWRQGFPAATRLALGIWLPPVLAITGALQPGVVGGWGVLLANGFLLTYLPSIALLLTVAQSRERPAAANPQPGPRPRAPRRPS